MTMALARPLLPLWQTLLPAVNGPVRPVLNLPFLQRLAHPFRTLPTPFAAFAIPSIQLPSFPSLGDIWEGILKAVPKKKTSYMKKRTRLMAGKGLKDITSLNKCSACGRVKRAHILCPYCVDGKPFLFLSRSNGIRQNSANRYGSHQNEHLRPTELGNPPTDD
jgi:large subunit ribosomal protein L32